MDAGAGKEEDEKQDDEREDDENQEMQEAEASKPGGGEDGKEEEPEEDPEQAKKRQEEAEEEQQRLMEEFLALEPEEFEYKLAGVVIHMGIAEAGHYLSYINIEREQDAVLDLKSWAQTGQQTWLEFNDSAISRFDFGNMEHKAFGEDAAANANAGMTRMANDYEASNANASAARSHNAYMLIYEKAIKRPLKVVCKEEDIELIQQLPESLLPKLRDPHQISTALSCEGTAITRELKPPLDE